jgi:hypothetical protein
MDRNYPFNLLKAQPSFYKNWPYRHLFLKLKLILVGIHYRDRDQGSLLSWCQIVCPNFYSKFFKER